MAEPQIVEDRYVDRQKLDAFLAQNFAKEQYRTEVRHVSSRLVQSLILITAKVWDLQDLRAASAHRGRFEVAQFHLDSAIDCRVEGAGIVETLRHGAHCQRSEANSRPGQWRDATGRYMCEFWTIDWSVSLPRRASREFAFYMTQVSRGLITLLKNISSIS